MVSFEHRGVHYGVPGVREPLHGGYESVKISESRARVVTEQTGRDFQKAFKHLHQ
jgi:hypothetical protein